LGISTLKLLFFLVAIPLFLVLSLIGPCWLFMLVGSTSSSSGSIWPALLVTLIGAGGLVGTIIALRRYLRATRV
jgi:hypothetical protein